MICVYWMQPSTDCDTDRQVTEATQGQGCTTGVPSGSEVGWLLCVVINDSIADIPGQAVIV